MKKKIQSNIHRLYQTRIDFFLNKLFTTDLYEPYAVRFNRLTLSSVRFNNYQTRTQSTL